MSSPSIPKLNSLPPEMNDAHKAAQEFLERHPDLERTDPLYERSVSARVVIAYHERLAESVEQFEMRRALGAKIVNELVAERNALSEQLEHDRTLVADCVAKATNAVRMRDWLTEGRGSFEWNDDNWHKELAAASTEFLEAIEPMRKVAADWSGCSKDAESVAKARIDLKAEYQRRGVEIIHWTEIAGAHMCRAENAEQEIKTNLLMIPDECRVIVREGGGLENDAASLAVSIRKLIIEYEKSKEPK